MPKKPRQSIGVFWPKALAKKREMEKNKLIEKRRGPRREKEPSLQQGIDLSPAAKARSRPAIEQLFCSGQYKNIGAWTAQDDADKDEDIRNEDFRDYANDEMTPRQIWLQQQFEEAQADEVEEAAYEAE